MKDVIVSDFDLSHFNTLRRPQEALIDLKPVWMQSIENINKIVTKHKFDDRFGIALLHRHHDLKDDQVLLEAITGKTSVTRPVTKTFSSHSIPHLFEFTVGGENDVVEIRPIEYLDLDSDTINPTELQAAVNALYAAKDFVKELATALVQSGSRNLLGLQLIHREGIISDRKTEFLSEISNHAIHPGDEDSSVIEAVKELPRESMPVFWFLGPEKQFCPGCIPEKPGIERPVHEGNHTEGAGCDCGGHCGCWNPDPSEPEMPRRREGGGC